MVVQGTNSCNSLGRLRPFSLTLDFLKCVSKAKNTNVIKYTVLISCLLCF